jgi:hypothetical protein
LRPPKSSVAEKWFAPSKRNNKDKDKDKGKGKGKDNVRG